METAKKAKCRATFEESPESSFGSEDEMPLSLIKKGKKKHKEVQPRRSLRKRRATARSITYNMDESEDSDIQILGKDKNKKEDSSDYVPPKSADSSEDPSSSIQEIDENEESAPTEESPVAQKRPALTPRRSGKNSKLVKTPRSSERLKSKKSTRFQMPPRKDIFDDIDAHSPKKGLSEVTPRKIVNDFTKVYNRYNHDPNYTSGESSVDDFIDDDESSEEETRRRKRVRQKKKKRGGRIIRPQSSSSSGSEDESVEEKKRQMNRSRIDSSSDSDAPVGPTKRKKLNSSVILDSDSGCEDGDATKEASCLQIDGIGDNGDSAETAVSMSCEAAGGMDNCAKEKKTETVCELADCEVGENKSAEDHVKSVDSASSGSCEGAVRIPGGNPAVASAETHPDAELSDKTPDFTNKKGVKDSNDVAVDQTSKSDETTSKEDKYMAVVICDSEDSMDEFIVKSDEEDEEELEPDDKESSDSDTELNVSNAHNRRFIASESESEEDETGGRRPSERARLMEERRQAHKNKFDVFRKRKAHKKGS